MAEDEPNYFIKVPNSEVAQKHAKGEMNFVRSFNRLSIQERDELMKIPRQVKVLRNDAIMMPFYNGGTLEAYNRDVGLNWDQKFKIASSLVRQLYLISIKLRGNYTDIKLRNVLVHNDGVTLVAHLSDFGGCEVIPNPLEAKDADFLNQVNECSFDSLFAPVSRHPVVGSVIRTIQKEIQKAKSEQPQDIDLLRDLCRELKEATEAEQRFAMGCTLLALFTSLDPEIMEYETKFYAVDMPKLQDRIFRIEPQELRDILNSLLDVERDPPVDLWEVSNLLKTCPRGNLL